MVTVLTRRQARWVEIWARNDYFIEHSGYCF